MYVFFEDDGQLKTGTLLSEQPASLQVELPSGRRLKIRSDRELLRFASPSAADALQEAQRLRAELDLDFLWEACADAEFGFEELARDYFGTSPLPPQAMAIALALYGAPMVFYKKGRGRYKKAPPDALAAARASQERKAREAAQMEVWHQALCEKRMPDALRDKLSMLLYMPDKNTIEYKAFATACDALKMHPAILAQACGALPSTHEYHFNRFLAHAFPRGTAFPSYGALPELPECPFDDVQAITIDDSTTTEFDDAFSVRTRSDGKTEIGLHIACPALALTHGTPLDAIARHRQSTVYMPGRKITMLPDAVIDAFTLAEGTTPMALSLYVTLDADGAPLHQETRLNRISIAANLRLNEIGEAFTRDATPDDPPHTETLRALWRFAQHRAEVRGKTEIPRTEFLFYVDWDAAPEGIIRIEPRLRGAALDRLVAECAIFVNNSWGQWLAEQKMAGIYRVQSNGRVKMNTRPGEHQGLGVSHYLWATSPLRRYSDLVNQQQLIAALRNETPPFKAGDSELLAIVADFEAVYRQYAEFQNEMERYWCLRWLLQENVESADAIVTRENSARLCDIPLNITLPDLPNTVVPGTLIRVALNNIDLLFSTLEARYLGQGSEGRCQGSEVRDQRSGIRDQGSEN
ncbi:MAG: RNB domain-containing ribonuclease [Proteobacteria bacterium]|nr:RNB domain-containing ribonuclease [Pseudomonadota bacterium]MCL2307546.1 RNB domain-containing ribonuclease [Pseudomonadota bacterium]